MISFVNPDEQQQNYQFKNLRNMGMIHGMTQSFLAMAISDFQMIKNTNKVQKKNINTKI